MAYGGGYQAFARGLAHAPFKGDVWQLMIFLYALGPDGCLEKLNQGVHDRLVDDCDPTFLPALAADRGGILRGLTEADDSFRARLGSAFDDLRIAGDAWSVLRQVLGHVLSSTPRGLTVSSTWLANVCKSSTWDEYAPGADTSKNPAHALYQTGSLGNWDWDSLTPTDGSWGWWRWYLVLEDNGLDGKTWIEKDGTWGSGGKWGDGKAWGVNASSAVGKSIKIIVGQWKANWCHWIIVSFDGAWFDRTLPAGGGVNPDGRFGRWSKIVNGVYVRARFSDACYFEGPT